MNKFKVGDKVRWADTGRLDEVTDIKKNLYGDVQYMTKEVVNNGNTPKIGKAYESYLIEA